MARCMVKEFWYLPMVMNIMVALKMTRGKVKENNFTKVKVRHMKEIGIMTRSMGRAN